MIALMLKDWYVLVRQSKFTMAIVLVFTCIGFVSSSVYYAAIGTIVCVMLPLTTMAYDQMNHWDQFVIGLPIERKDVVKSKYFLALLALSVSILMLAVFGVVFLLVNRVSFETILFMIWIQLFAGMFFISVNYPVVIKMGFERGRIWYLIITIPIVSLAGVLNSVINTNGMSLSASLGNFTFLIIPVLMLIGSYFLSVRFLENKDY